MTKRAASDLLKDQTVQDQFERWWAVYPRRVGKGAALKAFVTFLRQKRITFEQLMEKTAQYRAIRIGASNHPQYTPHPSTWLNQWRFEDETEIVVKKFDRSDVYNAVKEGLRRL